MPRGDEGADALVVARHRAVLDSYSILNVGHVTRMVEPIDRRAGIAEALGAFAARGEAEALPIAGERGVIGIVHRKSLLEGKAALPPGADPPVEAFMDRAALAIEASEQCEKAFSALLSRRPENLYDDFMIFERGRYLGMGGFAGLSRTVAEIRRMDLDKARAMQEYLLRRERLPGQGIAARSFLRMARGIGGDFLQSLDLGSGLTMLGCFDVCGKGTAAALLAAAVSAFFATMKASGALEGLSPPRLVSTLNRVVMDQTPEEVFIAGAMLFIDSGRRSATCFNCGFPPLYLLDPGKGSGKAGLALLKPELWPLGISDFAEPRGSRFPTFPGLKVLMHSDGLTDARNPKGERFGDEGVSRFLRGRCSKGAEEIGGELEAEIGAFVSEAPLADDITVLVAELL